MKITELPIDWRKKLSPASFRDAIFQFHVDSGGKASGRRIANHEFPKRNTPYSEDMGRKQRKWNVQGYIIISPGNTDYIPQRDALVRALEADGPGWLKLPTFDPEFVMCESYSCEETKDKGGYVAFTMSFCERGKPVAFDVQPDTRGLVGQSYTELGQASRAWLNEMIKTSGSGPFSSMNQQAVTEFMKGFNPSGGSVSIGDVVIQ